ncbi:mitochondrial carrier protein [Ceraceosorus bombacis]|uniref:Mitochondrial carrier protein n=1 Tax=Ceraceosorus bombacis TaxID=401625 RepID=A0A0P1BSV8_9BASI|nr:mitochondrial carrier protein [Ceraceosorus bombacis]
MDTIVPGALAAFFVDILIFPLDTIKTRVQAPDRATRFPNNRGFYKGLWQGLGPIIVVTLPSAGLFFTIYEESKSALTSADMPMIGQYTSIANSNAQALAHGTSSAMAELSSCALLAPAEMIKQRRQVSVQGSISSTVSASTRAIKSTLKERSVVMWRSYKALSGRNLPFTTLQFPIYEWTKDKLTKRFGLPARGKGRNGSGIRSAPLQEVSHASERFEQADKDRERARKGRNGSGIRSAPLQDVSHASERFEQADKGRERARARASRQIERAKSLDSHLAASSSQEEAEAKRRKAAANSYYLKAGLVSGASAAVAGSAAAWITTPIDVVKTRIMLSSESPSTTSASKISTSSTQGIVRSVMTIAKEEGATALFKGGALRMAWTALGAGLYLGAYEAGREWWMDSAKWKVEGLAEEVEETIEQRTGVFRSS